MCEKAASCAHHRVSAQALSPAEATAVFVQLGMCGAFGYYWYVNLGLDMGQGVREMGRIVLNWGMTGKTIKKGKEQLTNLGSVFWDFYTSRKYHWHHESSF